MSGSTNGLKVRLILTCETPFECAEETVRSVNREIVGVLITCGVIPLV